MSTHSGKTGETGTTKAEESIPGRIPDFGAPVTAAGTRGYIFPTGFSDGYCFVPLSCLDHGTLNEAKYVLSGWATRNVRLSAGRSVGSHLFPLSVDVPVEPSAEFMAALKRESP